MTVVALLLMASVVFLWQRSSESTHQSLFTGVAQAEAAKVRLKAPKKSIQLAKAESESMMTAPPSDPYLFINLLAVGSKAPAIETVNSDGDVIKLSDYTGKKQVVLVFYQGDFCSVCGRQLAGIQANYSSFTAKDTEVLAVSADGEDSAAKTKGERGLSFQVVPDPDHKVIKAFGVSNISRKGIAWPAVYVVAKDGTIKDAFADPNMTRLQADQILERL